MYKPYCLVLFEVVPAWLDFTVHLTAGFIVSGMVTPFLIFGKDIDLFLLANKKNAWQLYVFWITWVLQ